MSSPDADYVAVRFFFLLDAVFEGELPLSEADLDWALDLLDTLHVPEATIAAAEADHERMLEARRRQAMRPPRR